MDDVQAAGVDAEAVADTAQALDYVENRRPRLVLLDLLDKTVGPESTWRMDMRQMPRDLPFIVMLPEQELKTFDFPPQVVDFLLVPCGDVELAARLRLALGTRSGSGTGNTLERGALRIDLDRYQVTVAGEPVELTLKEFELLRFLMEHPGRVHTRESLMTQVWGYDYFGGTRTVDVHIRRIRSKLEPHADELVETVRGVGYRFRD